MTTIPIIDTHQHLWDLDRFRLPWLVGGGPLARSYHMQDYLAESAGLGVVSTIYMEVDVEASQRQAEAAYVIDLCERSDNPMAGAVIGGNPADSGFIEYIEAIAGVPWVKGVRQVLHGSSQPAGYFLQPEFVHGIRKLGELGLSFDLCMRPGELAGAAKLAERCPETRFILDHCGNGDVTSEDLSSWKSGMESLAVCENVVCKISGIVASAPPDWTPDLLAPIIEHTADVFGPDRIMFGSDWPVCTLRATYRQWVDALRQITASWPESAQHKLFHQNAAQFYGL